MDESGASDPVTEQHAPNVSFSSQICSITSCGSFPGQRLTPDEQVVASDALAALDTLGFAAYSVVSEGVAYARIAMHIAVHRPKHVSAETAGLVLRHLPETRLRAV